MSKADALASVVTSIAHDLVGPAAHAAYLQAIQEIGAGKEPHTGKRVNPEITEGQVSHAIADLFCSDATMHLPNIQTRTRWLAARDWAEQRDILLKGGWSPEEAEYIVSGLRKAANTIDVQPQERAA